MKRPLPILVAVAALGLCHGLLAEPPVPSHDDSFSKEGLLKADISKLKDTRLVAHPDVPLDTTRNVLWCGTLQLAWNKAIALVGEKLRFVNQPAVVDLLNQEDFTGAELDPASYVALADFEHNNVEGEIRAALQKIFQGAASPELIPPKPPHPGPDDFVAYAYFYKNLAFSKPFADNDPITFGTQPTANFGFVKDKEKLPAELFRQVSIYDYKSPDDFIISLKTKFPDDELILAKITPGQTLQETINQTLLRMAAARPEPATKRDELAVPKLNFDLRGDFPELEGLTLDPVPGSRFKGLKTQSVKQLIRFQLNEKGAILKSEAVVVMMTAVLAPSSPPHIMIFDKPFLILMKQANAKSPYLALWIGNASLLVPASAGK